MSGEFCVVCGRTDVPLTEGVCADCFAKNTKLLGVVDRPTVVLCPTCGSRMIGSHWERSGAPGFLTDEDLMPLLRPLDEVGIRRVAWEETGQNPLRREIRAVATVRFRGIERQVAIEFPVYIEHRTCPDCSRKSGRYYTSLIQFRGPEDRPKGTHRHEREQLYAVWARTIPDARKEWRNALSWEEERPEGWDFYLVDTLQARGLARWLKHRLGATLTESPSLYGRKDGRDVYRVTFCLRVPPGLLHDALPATPDAEMSGSSPRARAARRLERQP
jgi:nonsense-mediated mRNA decay protein 3